MAEIVWTENAMEMLCEVVESVAAYNIETAILVQSEILSQIAAMAKPMSVKGRQINGNMMGLKIQRTNYTVIYAKTDNGDFVIWRVVRSNSIFAAPKD